MDYHTLITCLIAVTLLTLTPGVDTLLVIRNSARGGWWDGAISSLGICSGLFVHALVSAGGISLILLQTAWAFSLLKLVGAGYLIWLGIMSWRNMLIQKEQPRHNQPATLTPQANPLRSLREGFLSNVLNPKAVIFYMAFLPQFITPEKSAMTQSLIVAALHFTVGMLWLCLLASMVDRAHSLLQNITFKRAFDGLTGSMMTFLGVRLLLEE